MQENCHYLVWVTCGVFFQIFQNDDRNHFATNFEAALWMPKTKWWQYSLGRRHFDRGCPGRPDSGTNMDKNPYLSTQDLPEHKPGKLSYCSPENPNFDLCQLFKLFIWNFLMKLLTIILISFDWWQRVELVTSILFRR